MTKQKLQPEVPERAMDSNRPVEISDVGRPWVSETI